MQRRLSPFLCAFIFTVIISVTSLHCKKAAVEEEGRLSFDKEGLRFIQLPVNKYYIYKDSATGNLDSVIVTKSLLEQVDVPAYYGGGFNYSNHPAYHYQRFSLILSKVIGNTQNTWFKGKTSDIVAYTIIDDQYPIYFEDSSFI